MLIKIFPNRRSHKLKGESARKRAEEFKFGFSKAIYSKTNSNSIKKSYGPKSSIEYLLREKERKQYEKIKDNVNANNTKKLKELEHKLENVRLLRGDPKLSLGLAEHADSIFSNSYTVGCLAFEEKHLTEEMKNEIMDSFEELVFAGIDFQNRNILWVEHTDKKNLELNFFIANIELSTFKNFTPYYHKADKRLFSDWRDLTNNKYNLTNPLDPRKKQKIVADKRCTDTEKQIRETIHKQVKEAVRYGELKDRKQVIKFIKKMGYKVDRTTKQSISIKNPNSDKKRNIRLTGEFYEDGFNIDKSKEEKKNWFISEDELNNKPKTQNDINQREPKQILDDFCTYFKKKHDKNIKKFSQSDVKLHEWRNEFENFINNESPDYKDYLDYGRSYIYNYSQERNIDRDSYRIDINPVITHDYSNSIYQDQLEQNRKVKLEEEISIPKIDIERSFEEDEGISKHNKEEEREPEEVEVERPIIDLVM